MTGGGFNLASCLAKHASPKIIRPPAILGIGARSAFSNNHLILDAYLNQHDDRYITISKKQIVSLYEVEEIFSRKGQRGKVKAQLSGISLCAFARGNFLRIVRFN